MRRFVIAAVLIALSAPPIALLSAPTAYAAPDEFSIPVADLPTDCGDISDATEGGWTGMRATSYTNWRADASKRYRPTLVRIGEPCLRNSTTMGIKFTALAPTGGDWYSPNTASSSQTFGIPLDTWRCVNATGQIVNFRGNGGSSGISAAPPTYVSYLVRDWPIPTGCVELVQFTLRVPYGVSTATAEVPIQYRLMTWTAERELSDEEYGPVDFGPGAEEQCEEDIQWAICEALQIPNPTSYLDTCGNLDNSNVYGVEYATWNPVDGETWGPALAWSMACLFMPLEGFDRSAVLADAAEMHPNAAVLTGYATIGNALTSTGSCGVLLDATGTVLEGLVLDTCQWTWAGAWRTLMLAFGAAWLSWWALSYIVNSTFDVINKRMTVPVPKS